MDADDYAYFEGVDDVFLNQEYAYYLPNPAPTGALDRIIRQQRNNEQQAQTEVSYAYRHPQLKSRSTVFSTWRVENRPTHVVGNGTTRRNAQDLVINFHIVDRLGKAPIYDAMTVVLPGYPRASKSSTSCIATINNALAFSGVPGAQNWQNGSQIECAYSIPDGTKHSDYPRVCIAIPGLPRQFKIVIYTYIAGTTKSAARIFSEWYRSTVQFKTIAASRGLTWPTLRLRMT